MRCIMLWATWKKRYITKCSDLQQIQKNSLSLDFEDAQNRLRPAREATSLWTTGGARIAPGSPEFWESWHIIASFASGGWSSLPQVPSRLSLQPCKRCSYDALFRVVYLWWVICRNAKQTYIFFVGFLNLKFQKHISCFRAGTELWWCHL